MISHVIPVKLVNLIPRFGFVFVFSISIFLGPSEILAQPIIIDSTGSEIITDKKPHPNTIPYSSDRTVFEHVLALPAYVFDWVTMPLEYGLKVTERKLPQLLQGERGPYGIYPLFELGGNTDFAYGFLGFHNELWKQYHRLRLTGIFGSKDYNNFELDYTIPSFLSKKGTFEIDAFYGNDPSVSLFMGNDADLNDKLIYSTEKAEASLEYGHKFTNQIKFSTTSSYYMLNIGRSDFDEENLSGSDIITPIPDALTGTASMLSIKTNINFNLASGTPRINKGSRYGLAIDWQQSLNNDDYHFVEYTAEWNQFIPFFFLPDSRRLAFKGALNKIESLGGKATPFFALPSLGGSSNLRGYTTNRFRDSGSLLLTLEYRYPLWSFADIVLFIDEGHVFNHYSEISLEEFHENYGAGLHFLSAKGFAFRGEYAFSTESSRLILSINKNF
ncbi:MAG: BamA/TamA family outer membrane protein [Gracilimonas sp.]